MVTFCIEETEIKENHRDSDAAKWLESQGFKLRNSGDTWHREGPWIFLGILASSVSFVLWNVACKGNGIARSSVILYLTPIVGVAFAALFLGERLSPMSVCGGILIIGGLVIANRRRK